MIISKNVKDKYDTIVIGAGPAGSMAAYLLAKNGYDVLLLEREKIPRHKPCAGGLTVFSLETLKRNGLYSEKFIVHRTSKGCAVFPLFKGEVCFPMHVAMTNREIFDTYLARKAEDKGTDLQDREPVQKIEYIKHENKIMVKTTKQTYISRAAILACGQPCKLATSIGINPIYGKAAAFEFDAPMPDGLDIDTIYMYMALKKGFSGYLWVFPKGDYANIGFGTWIETVSELKREQKGDIRKWVRNILDNLGVRIEFQYIAKMKGHLIPLYWGSRPEDAVTNNIIAIGDTVGLVNFAGEGISHALRSAEAAATTISIGLEQDMLDKEFLKRKYSEFAQRLYQELSVTPKLEKTFRIAPKTIYNILKENEEARKIFGTMLEHSVYMDEAARDFEKQVGLFDKLKVLLEASGFFK